MEYEHAVEVNIRSLEELALEKYIECPKHITIVRHADLEDDSEFHCTRTAIMGPLRKGEGLVRNFIVPGQTVIMARDPKYGLFSVIRVSEEVNGPEFALVASVNSRMGFLLPLEKLPRELLGVEVQI